MLSVSSIVARRGAQSCVAAVASQVARRGIHVEAKLDAMGLKLVPATPKANYVNLVRSDKTIYLSGHLPVTAEGELIVGKVPAVISEEKAYEAAKCTMLSLLGTLKNEIGDLDRVQRIVKLTGMVNCTPEFVNHPKVINGASDLLIELYGVRGKHTRVACGMGSLPLGVPCEIDMIVEVLPDHVKN